MSDTNAQTIAYVRDTMLPQTAPPVREAGAIKWLRENLFSSWLNALLTLVSLYVIWWALSHVLPWMLSGVWDAGSLSECREILAATGDGTHGGACWATIEDRWLQLLFGFYPPEFYWRPVLALILLFVALAPVLFPETVPARLMYFSVLFPFVAVWLIWGGSIWGPLLVLAGFVVGVVAFRVANRLAGSLVGLIAGVVAALVWWLVLLQPINDGLHRIVGASRMAAAESATRAWIDELPGIIAAVEERQAEIAARIAEQVAAKDSDLDEIRALRVEETAVTAQIDARRVAAAFAGVALDTIEEAARLAAGPRDEETDRALAKAIEDARRAAASAAGAIADEASSTAGIADRIATAVARDAGIGERLGALADTTALAEALASVEQTLAALPSGSASAIAAAAAGVTGDLRAARAAILADIGILQEVRGRVSDTIAADLAAPTAALLARMDDLTILRNAASTEARAAFRLTQELSAARALLAEIEALPDRMARIEELRPQVAEAERALPRSLRGLVTTSLAPEGTTSDDLAQLTRSIALRDQLQTTENAVRQTYAAVGRFGLVPVESREIGGFMLGMIIGIAGIVLSLPLGILLALGRQSDLWIINKISVGFIEIIRGVPLIVWLFTASLLLNYFLPPGTNFDLMLRVIIMVTLFSAAYIAEVVRGGLAALPKGQYEAADSLGLDYWKSMRLIILPQALKISIPGIVNTFIGLFKDTTLVVFIGLLDPIGLSNSIRASTDWNGVYWELFIYIGLLFFIFCYAMGRYSMFLEKKLAREHR